MSFETEEERTAFFSKYGVRWSEFVRLTYFDCIRMTLIDPMHNLLLGTSPVFFHIIRVTYISAGLVKTQWYGQWIRGSALRADTEGGTKRELNMIHNFLKSVSTHSISFLSPCINPQL